jgi:hypothetical protein
MADELWIICPNCKGSGKVGTASFPCGDCSWTGKIDENPDGGPLDDLILAKVRELLTTATDPARLSAAVVAEFGWSQSSANEVGAMLSDKLRAFLTPLVQP